MNREMSRDKEISTKSEKVPVMQEVVLLGLMVVEYTKDL